MENRKKEKKRLMQERLVLKSYINLLKILICNTQSPLEQRVHVAPVWLTLDDSCDVNSHEVVLLFCILLLHVKQITPWGR